MTDKTSELNTATEVAHDLDRISHLKAQYGDGLPPIKLPDGSLNPAAILEWVRKVDAVGSLFAHLRGEHGPTPLERELGGSLDPFSITPDQGGCKDKGTKQNER